MPHGFRPATEQCLEGALLPYLLHPIRPSTEEGPDRLVGRNWPSKPVGLGGEAFRWFIDLLESLAEGSPSLCCMAREHFLSHRGNGLLLGQVMLRKSKGFF